MNVKTTSKLLRSGTYGGVAPTPMDGITSKLPKSETTVGSWECVTSLLDKIILRPSLDHSDTGTGRPFYDLSLQSNFFVGYVRNIYQPL